MNRPTHHIDATNKTLGRLSTEIATLLRGKNKVGFTYHQDHGDIVHVSNVEKIKVTGKKAVQKKYYRHSTYPGGLTEITFEKMRQTFPERILQQAVRNMLPDNRLRNEWMKRLIIEKATKEKA